jgi:hypothetical protein
MCIVAWTVSGNSAASRRVVPGGTVVSTRISRSRVGRSASVRNADAKGRSSVVPSGPVAARTAMTMISALDSTTGTLEISTNGSCSSLPTCAARAGFAS